MIYIPKGSMCRVCEYVSLDCSGFDFDEMPVLKNADAKGRVIVKCIEFKKAEKQQKKTPVDLSVLIGSGIDCEFYDNESYITTCTLREIKGKVYRSQVDWYWRCTPRMNYWFSVDNFEPGSVMRLLDKLEDAGFLLGTKYSSCDDITSFRINGIADHRCWPWEC